jgi:hypothetical protein
MFTSSTTSKPIVRMAAAACIASAVAFAITALPGANAGSQIRASGTESYALANPDRLRVPAKANVCSAHGWPNFEPKCQFDLREPAGEARTIRVIAIR